MDVKSKKSDPQDTSRASRTVALRVYFGELAKGKTKKDATNSMRSVLSVSRSTCQRHVKVFFLEQKKVLGFKSFTRNPSPCYVSSNHDVLKQTLAIIEKEKKSGTVKGVRVSAVREFVSSLEIVKKHKKEKGISARTARRVLKALGYYCHKKASHKRCVCGRP